MGSYKKTTAFVDASTGQSTASKLAPGTRVWAEANFGRDIVTSASYAAIMSDYTNPNHLNVDNEFVLSGEAPAAAVNSRGGTTLTAQSSDSAYGVLVKPRTNARFNTIKWDTSLQPSFNALVQTGSGAVTNTAIQAGLVLTGAMDLTTDNDQVKFFYNDSYTTWQIALSNGTADYVVDTGVTVEASTLYNFTLEVNADRTVTGYINGVEVGTTEALDATTDLIPLVGVASDGGAADSTLTIYRILCSQNIA